jgi:hypothetical protein
MAQRQVRLVETAKTLQHAIDSILGPAVSGGPLRIISAKLQNKPEAPLPFTDIFTLPMLNQHIQKLARTETYAFLDLEPTEKHAQHPTIRPVRVPTLIRKKIRDNLVFLDKLFKLVPSNPETQHRVHQMNPKTTEQSTRYI